MKLNVAQIQGLLANNFEVTVDADAALNFTEGSELVITNLTTSHMIVPYRYHRFGTVIQQVRLSVTVCFAYGNNVKVKLTL